MRWLFVLMRRESVRSVVRLALTLAGAAVFFQLLGEMPPAVPLWVCAVLFSVLMVGWVVLLIAGIPQGEKK